MTNTERTQKKRGKPEAVQEREAKLKKTAVAKAVAAEQMQREQRDRLCARRRAEARVGLQLHMEALGSGELLRTIIRTVRAEMWAQQREEDDKKEKKTWNIVPTYSVAQNAVFDNADLGQDKGEDEDTNKSADTDEEEEEEEVSDDEEKHYECADDFVFETITTT